MRNLAFWFGIAAAVPTICAYSRLARLVTQPTEVKPNLASWLLFLVIDGSIFYASLVAGVRTSMIVFGVFTLGCLLIVILTVRKSRVEFTLLEKVCLVLSASAFVGWKMTSSPELAVYLNVLVAVIATIPTIIQAWMTPEREDLGVWLYFSFGGVLNLFAVEKWDALNALPAVMVLLLQVVLAGILLRPRWKRFRIMVLGW